MLEQLPEALVGAQVNEPQVDVKTITLESVNFAFNFEADSVWGLVSVQKVFMNIVL